MKKIEAFIRPEKVGAVRRALEKVDINGLNITQVDGHGKQKGTVQKFGGSEYKVGILPKTKLEIVVRGNDVTAVVDAIIEAAKTGEIGDGKIFISPVEEAIRIRTQEKGENAL
jgi:nitrogen regulatory protein P-II 1